VVIKGTEIYDAQSGGFKDVGQLDVQQIFGRAGRPDYDTSGKAYIITTTNKI
jgi:activating signal cointegrator complex subunit 3